jgi:OmpA-OmpF porin, OOP family
LFKLNKMVRFFLLFILSGFGHIYGQNLIINGGFESPPDPLTCSYALYDNFSIDGWYSPSSGTSDIFCLCSPPPQNGSISIPNVRGYQYSHMGIAMAGIVIYPGIEYLTTHLLTPLDSNKYYCLKFYINKGNDLSQFILSVDRIGIYFSKDSIYMPGQNILPYTPQIETPNGVFYEDTLGWTKVELQYLAKGGERYMTIGNFRPDSLTHTNPPNPNVIYGAYYYFDDFSLEECKWNGIDESNINKVSIYPNPSAGAISVAYNLPNVKNAVFSLYTTSGQLLFNTLLNTYKNSQTIETDMLENGVYLYGINGAKGIIASGKLVLIK